jgi:hypothetical protein
MLTANLLKALLARLMSRHFHSRAYFERMQLALRKVCLQDCFSAFAHDGWAYQNFCLAIECDMCGTAQAQLPLPRV